ncbi:MAG: hypothetical protein V9G10_17440 [Candidatus Nanopelagicales bacterium]
MVDPGVNSLLDLHHHPHRRAGSGRPGEGGHRNGAGADDLIVPVPPGTVVQTEAGEALADLARARRAIRARGRRARRVGQRGAGHPQAVRRRASRCSANPARSSTRSWSSRLWLTWG